MRARPSGEKCVLGKLPLFGESVQHVAGDDLDGGILPTEEEDLNLYCLLASGITSIFDNVSIRSDASLIELS